MVLYGPPGSGKTTLARMVAERSRRGLRGAERGAGGARRGARGDRARRAPPRRPAARQTVLFLDEIHRFNKAQQDALLPAVEEGLVTLIGATTENPAFEVNGALLSRAARLRAAGAQRRGARAVLRARPRASGARRSTSEAIEFLAARSEGDARTALNALELALRRRPRELGEAARRRSRASRTRCSAARCSTTKQGDRHYDYISAWIKATRGSDPDASLYYLAVMLEGGEDPRFIVRRMVILASEDIGNADPAALSVATAAARAVEHVGPARGALRARAGRDLPGARAEVQRRRPRARRGAARTCASTARRRCPAGCAPGPRPGQERGGYDNPHGHPGHVSPAGAAAGGRRRRALLRARRGRGASSRARLRARSAGRAGSSSDNRCR